MLVKITNIETINMIKVLVNGCNGRMGQVVCNLATASDKFIVSSGFDRNIVSNSSFPIYTEIKDIKENPDVIVDFSVPEATFKILDYAVINNIPVVIATTGFSAEQIEKIKDFSTKIPIFQSANMSYDINIMKKLVSWLAPMMKDTDIEITEVHHNRKIDSPSGTAQMLADTINEALGGDYHCEYNRHDKREKREKKEIGMSSIRGGNIVGEHTVQFFGEFETFEIKHTSYSRNVFAEGSLKAAEFIIGMPAGLYRMEDMCKI